MTKLVDPLTGACRLVSADPALRSWRALDSARAAWCDRDRRTWGALRGQLRSRLQTMRPDERVDVRIHLRAPQVRYPNRRTHTPEQLRAFSLGLARAEAALREAAGELARRYGLRPGPAVAAGIVETAVTRGQMERMMFDPEVAVIEEFVPPAPCRAAEEWVVVPWSALAEAALNPAAHPDDRAGAGVRAATIEWDTTWAYMACRLGLGARPRDPTHADQVLGCLLNAAPAATVLHRLGNSYAAVSGWLADSAIETVSMSLASPPTSSPDAMECLVIDDLAYRWPFTVFCAPAGNGSAQSLAMWACYSGICVGSMKHWQQAGYLADLFTSTRNPPPLYGACAAGGDCAGDRELPEILAPGSHPYQPPGDGSFTYLWSDPCFRGYFFGDGTSFAAPTANGIAARAISSAPVLLKGRPEAVKMTLLLTASNVDGGEWDVAEDGRDGAGGISAFAAVEYLRRCTDLSGMARPPAVEHGFFTDTGCDGMGEQEFLVRTPDVLPESSHLRVVLTWTSNPDMIALRNSLSDLDIGAFISDMAAYGSYSIDASVEMFDVPRAELTPAAVYPFRLFPRAIRIPPGARARFFYYALGWTWVRDHAPEVAVRRPRPGGAGPVSPGALRVEGCGPGRLGFVCVAADPVLSAEVSVLDMRGAVVCRSAAGPLSAGANRLRLTLPPGLAAGTYCLRVAGPGLRAETLFAPVR